MLKIAIPDNFIAERTYIVDILLGELLDIEYEIDRSDSINYEIVLENKSKLTIEDHFFSKINNSGYLMEENIPRKVEFVKNDFIPENNIPVIYGTQKFTIKGDNLKTICCGIDVFASSFFMLTRWEEYVVQGRDRYNRFTAWSSLALKNNFLHRPIVNEYIEMLWNILKYLGVKQNRKQKEFRLKPSCDVDQPFLYSKGICKQTKVLAADMLIRKDIKRFYQHLKVYTKTYISNEQDPYNTFSFLLTESGINNLVSGFHFMSSKNKDYELGYNINNKHLKRILKEINRRGHSIGFHPGYYTYNNNDLWKTEKLLLDSVLQSLNLPKSYFGRQHYLRFEVPETWQIWENNEMQIDSTLAYPEKEGFRCGVCDEYSVFNVLTRKKLNLKEWPLIVMEGTFLKYQKIKNIDDVYRKIESLIKTVKKYRGMFTILTHNHSISDSVWKGWRECYSSILRLANNI